MYDNAPEDAIQIIMDDFNGKLSKRSRSSVSRKNLAAVKLRILKLKSEINRRILLMIHAICPNERV